MQRLCARDAQRPSDRLLALAAVSVLPAVLLLGPTFVMFSYCLTALASPALAVLVLLLMATLLPQTTLLPARLHTAIAPILLVVGAALYLTALLINSPSADMPRQNCLAYAVNFDTGEAWWLSGDAKTDAWTRRYIPDGSPRVAIADLTGDDDGYTYLRASAPAPSFDKTVLNVIEDRTENGRRYLKLFVDSPRDAQTINVCLKSEANIYSATAFGIAVDGKQGRADWNLTLETITFEGGEIQLETDPSVPLKFVIHETSFCLPEIPGFTPRPAQLMTQTNRRIDRSQHLRSEHCYSVCTYAF